MILFLFSRSPKLLHTGGLHHSYQEASTNQTPTISPDVNSMQQRSLSTNIPVVDHYKPSPINLSVLIKPNPLNTITNKFIISNSTINRTASKKRREFGKEKRQVSANVNPTTTNEEYKSTVHQVKKSTMLLFLHKNIHLMFIRLMKSKQNLLHHYRFDILIFVEQNPMKQTI
jgi:hypothetical protein